MELPTRMARGAAPDSAGPSDHAGPRCGLRRKGTSSRRSRRSMLGFGSVTCLRGDHRRRRCAPNWGGHRPQPRGGVRWASPVRANADFMGSAHQTPQLDGSFERMPGTARSPAASRTRPSAMAALAASACSGTMRPPRASSSAASRAPTRSPVGHVDLHSRGEQRGTAQVGVRRPLFGGDGHGMVECVSDGCRCQSNVALSQTHLGESGLRIPPGFAGGEEGLLRALEVTQLEIGCGPTR